MKIKHNISINDKKSYSQRKCNPSPLILSLITISLLAVVIVTKAITSTTQITPTRPSIQILVKEKTQEVIFKPSSQERIDDGGGDGIELPEKPQELIKPSSQETIDDGGGIELPPKSCDLSKGKWVFDNVTRPLYKEEKCEFLTTQVTCTRNGREDKLYQNWRWQPDDCSLPKFDAKVMLEKLRGKRLMFVGDSLNRNQWESLVCLLNTGIAPGRATFKIGAPLSYLSIKDYNATVEFYWSPFLVESNSDDPRNHSISQRILMAESISRHGIHWKAADFLVFNSYIWWMNNATIKLSRGPSDQGSLEYDEVERAAAYGRVMATWAEWLKHNVNHTLTKSFFIGMSPIHWQSSRWNNPDGIRCARETMPILNTTMELDLGTDKQLLDVLRNTIKTKEVPVSVIDITTLSEYRKDGHTSVYTLRQGKLLTPEQQADPATFADCLHWCLPGVPDTWNEFLYTHIIST